MHVVCADLRYHSADVLGVDEFSSGNKQTLPPHLLKVFLILHLQGGGDIKVCLSVCLCYMTLYFMQPELLLHLCSVPRRNLVLVVLQSFNLQAHRGVVLLAVCSINKTTAISSPKHLSIRILVTIIA